MTVPNHQVAKRAAMHNAPGPPGKDGPPPVTGGQALRR